MACPLARLLNVSRRTVAVLLVAGLSGSAVAHEGHAALPSTGATVDGDELLVSGRARQGLGLETATVTLGDLSRSLRVRASVELPFSGQALVTSLAPGRVQSIQVRPGEAVEAGQELARIESFELETLQLAMLEAAEQAAFAERLVAQRQPLYERGSIPRKSLLEAESDLRQKRSQLGIARRKLLALGLSRETLEQVLRSGSPIPSLGLTSPISGVMLHADARVGQFVTSEQHLFNVVDSSQVLVVGEVLETDLWQVAPGQAAEITFPALPERAFTGSLDRLGLGVHPTERTLRAVVPVDNRSGRLRAGMSGRMRIEVGRREEAILCPAAALIESPGQTHVLLRRGQGKYQRREVRVGMRGPGQVEILDGLFPGDRVIVTGTGLLASLFPATGGRRAPGDAAAASSPVAGRGAAQAIGVAQGRVELPPSQKAFATPAVEGRIAAIHVAPGETVQAGQLLADLGSQELRGLQLEVLEVEERRRWGEERIARLEPLTRSGGYSASQLWEHQMEQKTLEHRARSLERRLSMIGLSPEAILRLRQGEADTPDARPALVTVPLHAPASGQLAEFEVVPGQIVHADDPVFEIQDLETVWIEGYVFEQDAPRVEVGQRAEARFPAYPELQLAGRVVRVSPTLRSAARVLPVWIEVASPERPLREGMIARVQILSEPAGSRIAVGARDAE